MPGALESVTSWPKAIKEYFGELQNEMKRVTWPSSKQVQATTAVVIITVFAFAAYFNVVDSILDRTITRIPLILAR